MKRKPWEWYLIDTSTLPETTRNRRHTTEQQHHVTHAVAWTLVQRKRDNIELPPVDTLGAILGKDDFEVTLEIVMQIRAYFQRLDTDGVEKWGITSHNKYTILKAKKEYLKTKLSLDKIDPRYPGYLILLKWGRVGIYSLRNNTFILLPTPESQASYFAYVSEIYQMEYATMTDALMVWLSGQSHTDTFDAPTFCVGYIDRDGTFQIIDTSWCAELRDFSETIWYITGCAVASGWRIPNQEKVIH